MQALRPSDEKIYFFSCSAKLAAYDGGGLITMFLFHSLSSFLDSLIETPLSISLSRFTVNILAICHHQIKQKYQPTHYCIIRLHENPLRNSTSRDRPAAGNINMASKELASCHWGNNVHTWISNPTDSRNLTQCSPAELNYPLPTTYTWSAKRILQSLKPTIHNQIQKQDVLSHHVHIYECGGTRCSCTPVG